MTLAPHHPLGGVKPARAAAFGGLYALTVDDAGGGNEVTPIGLANPHDKIGIETMPRSIVAPAIEVTLHRRAWREVLRQRAPLAASRQNVEDRIQYSPQINRPRTPQTPPLGQEWDDQSPFFIHHIACVT